VKLATYNWWFDGQSEPGFPSEMLRYICGTHGIPFAHVEQLMRLRTEGHPTWQLKRDGGSDLLCPGVSAYALGVRVMLLRMSCMFYLHALLIINRYMVVYTLFSRFGDDLQSAISRVLTREPRTVPEFMNQEPKVVGGSLCG
jgi:hypothetical protein